MSKNFLILWIMCFEVAIIVGYVWGLVSERLAERKAKRQRDFAKMQGAAESARLSHKYAYSAPYAHDGGMRNYQTFGDGS